MRKSPDSGDLQLARLYRALPDGEAKREGLVRVIDDSGEDYLYPEGYFAPVTLNRVTADLVGLAG